MTTDNAKLAAKSICADRVGADYYRDERLLGNYLKGALTIRQERADEIASAIGQDRQGAYYYKDEELLADFLGDMARR